MMTQPFPAHAGMAPGGHPGMQHHPMAGMQHPGGHMGGQPGPGMMQGMHPVSGPQVTQGPMVTGMPPGAGTPAPGGPMHNGAMAMAHLGPQGPMFQQHNPQMNFPAAQMPITQQQLIARQRMMAQISQQQHQPQGMPMTMPNGAPGFNQAQLAAQMKMNMPMQQGMQMHPNPQVANFQQQQHQQRIMAQAQQAAIAAQQNQQRAVAAQQMQLSRSQEQPTTQPPQSHPTPAPQNQPQPTPQPTPQPQATPVQQKPTPQPQPNNQQPPNQATPQPKPNEAEEEAQIKQPEPINPMLLQDIPKQQDFNGQCILQLIQYQDSLANQERANDLDYWEETIRKYFSPFGSIRQQLFSTKQGTDKSFQLQYPSLARFYHAHFVGGVKRILLQSYDHNQLKLPNGGMHIWSQNATLTYVFGNDIRIITTGSLRVNFDELNKIEHLNLSTSGWQEYIPRPFLTQPISPDQKQSPKMNKNVKRAQGKSASAPMIPTSGVGEYGVPQHIMQFLEIAEIMSAMGPLMEYSHMNPGLGPREALYRITQENHINFQNAQQARLQNQMVRAANGQMPFPNQMPPGMNGPNHFQSPGMAHLGLPQGQGSPHLGGPVHTPSPAQNQIAGGVAMMHQMSAQGSNLSGSQGPSTNTSPNVSNKRRRPSAIKLEEEGAVQDGNNANKVKPSPRIGGKRQKGAA